MKRRSKRRLAPTTRVDGVAGKRKRFRGGVGIGIPFGKTFGPEVKILPGTTAAKTAKIELTTPVIFLSLSTMSKAERAVKASEENKLHVRLDPQSGHTRKTPRDFDLKLTRLRTPATTTNATQNRRGVILR